MDPDVAVARQLVYAFTDALDEGDADALEYAEQQLADFVDETDDGTADEILVALLDLPLDPSTLPLLNEVSTKLIRRGPGVVEVLLGAALGEAPPGLSLRDVVSVAGAVGALLEAATRSPDVPPRTENALSVLEAMVQGDLILGLIEVLEGSDDERLKQAASEMLVDIGDPAVERLKTSLRDRDAAPWVVDTLVYIRDQRDSGRFGNGDGLDDAPANDDACDDKPASVSADASDDGLADDGLADASDEGLADDGLADASDDGLADDALNDASDDGLADDALEDTLDGASDAPADDAHAAASDGRSGAPARLPAGDLIERDYDAFLEKFKRETGQR